MILLSLDFETTGVDTQNDRVIEVGAVLYSTSQNKCLENLGVLVQSDVEVSPEITRITGIHPLMLERFGYDSQSAFDLLQMMATQADAFIGYNCRRFDKKVYERWASLLKEHSIDKPWIDLFMDLPFTVPTGKLSHVAADHGLLNLFPHSAMSDAQTVISIANKYDPKLLLSRSQSPAVVVISQAARSENDIVKKAKFRWNPSNKVWWKPVKEIDLDEFVKTIPFRVVVNKELTIEEMDQ